MTEAFHESGSEDLLLVVLTNENGLGPADEAAYTKLVAALRQDTRDVVMLQDFVSTPPLRPVLTSKDHKSWVLPVGIAGELGTPKAHAAYLRVADIVKHNLAGTRLTANLTGPAATVADLTAAGERGSAPDRACDRGPGTPRSAGGLPQPGHDAAAVDWRSGSPW